jgi:serine/threonine protein phosphatase PrpC
VRLGGHASRTDTGHRRRRNEDSHVVRPPLFAVADGMGGAQAGEVASRLAAAALDESGGSGRGEQQIVELVQEAYRRVFQRATEDAATQGMGTTMTVALVDDANVSRRHAEVRQEGATYWIVDLDSTNGTELNGRRVSRAKLADGDTITVGGTEIVFGRSLP